MGRPAASWKGVSAEVGQTGRMRIYLPATAAHLRASVLGSSHQPLTAHAATPALAQALPEEDEEGLEVSASPCASSTTPTLLPRISAQHVISSLLTSSHYRRTPNIIKRHHRRWRVTWELVND